jgi:hypothetical protein
LKEDETTRIGNWFDTIIILCLRGIGDEGTETETTLFEYCSSFNVVMNS